jgi:hypothetical protein
VMQRQFGDDPLYAPQTDDSSSDTHEDTHRVLGVDVNCPAHGGAGLVSELGL